MTKIWLVIKDVLYENFGEMAKPQEILREWEKGRSRDRTRGDWDRETKERIKKQKKFDERMLIKTEGGVFLPFGPVKPKEALAQDLLWNTVKRFSLEALLNDSDKRFRLPEFWVKSRSPNTLSAPTARTGEKAILTIQRPDAFFLMDAERWLPDGNTEIVWA